MSDLISRSALINRRRRVVEYDEAGFSMEYFAVPVEEINNAPTVEEKPVVRGKWEEVCKIHTQNGMMDVLYCPICKCDIVIDSFGNFCPNCGADMRGGKND